MRTKKLAFFIFILSLWLPAFYFATPAIASNKNIQVNSDKGGPLSFQDRVAYQRAIEAVYWQHRIWPKDNPAPKPSLDKILPEAAIAAKVEDYLRKSNALEQYWNRPVSPEQLKAEMDRIVRNTKQPQLLRELFEALNNDPHVIAECLARPTLVDRLVHNWYAKDERFHGELRQRVEGELRGANTQSMHGLTGRYSEMVRVKQTNADVSGNSTQISLNAPEWKKWTDKLQTMFGKQIQTQKLSPILEETDRFYVMAVLEKGNDRIKTAMVEWPKTGFDSWWRDERKRIPVEIVEAFVIYKLEPLAASGACVDNTWTPTQDFPESRDSHTAIWTGTEMIIWGGNGNSGALSSGGRYNPSTDSWTATSIINAPEGLSGHTGIWTGTQMIVWGGSSGGRYDPLSDSWTAMNNVNAPDARSSHTAIWTGTEMIIWGGSGNSGRLSSGGRYDPLADSWTATSNTNVPDARYLHTAVWTGTEMIVWGGSGNSGPLSSGGRYDPSTDTWTATSNINAPETRYFHTAVWTGSEMIVWGGRQGNTGLFSGGGRYNPSTDTWTATSNTNAPEARRNHSAVWTGTEMIVWGGSGNSGLLSSGARYDPTTDNWIATSDINKPEARTGHTVVWTGTESIIWGGDGIGGLVSSGGRYDPSSNTWVVTNNYLPEARSYHTAVWTGTEMIVWGGIGFSPLFSGGRYNPSTDSWTATSTTNVPDGRYEHTAVWTGTEMIVWGGIGFSPLFSGGRYNPSTDSWTVISNINAPGLGTAVWTGIEMIVWGSSPGGRYDPSTDSWTATSTTDEPEARNDHTAVWTGTEMIVWGGSGNGGVQLSSGGRYDPSTDGWTATSTTNVPAAVEDHTAVWTGTEMIVWGGIGVGFASSGGRYDPSTDSWTATSNTKVPLKRFNHTAVWTGAEMIVWGGLTESEEPTGDYTLSSGGRYNPTTDSWTATSTTNVPSRRQSHTAVWTGTEMIAWGGDTYDSFDNPLQTGGLYCANAPVGVLALTISDVSLQEGTRGKSKFQFVVTLSSPAKSRVKVNYATADGTATVSGDDYLPKSGVAKIKPGDTTVVIKIKVKGDKLTEDSETFTVNLSNAIGAVILDSQGVGTILNDD